MHCAFGPQKAQRVPTVGVVRVFGDEALKEFFGILEAILLYGKDRGAIKQLGILGAGFKRLDQHVKSRLNLFGF